MDQQPLHMKCTVTECTVRHFNDSCVKIVQSVRGCLLATLPSGHLKGRHVYQCYLLQHVRYNHGQPYQHRYPWQPMLGQLPQSKSSFIVSIAGLTLEVYQWIFSTNMRLYPRHFTVLFYQRGSCCGCRRASLDLDVRHWEYLCL